MLTGIDINEKKPYVLQEERGKENPTTFHLGVIDSIAMAHIEDETTEFVASSSNPDDDAVGKINWATRSLLVVLFGLRGVDNLRDAQGETVEFRTMTRFVGKEKYTVVAPSVLRVLRPAWIAELSREILAGNRLSEGEAKN